MKIALIASVIGASLALNVSAQTSQAQKACARAPADKMASCVQFVETCRFDEGKSAYVNRKDGKACGATPAMLPSKEQIRAERMKFLASNKLDEGKTAWVPLDKPRQVCVDTGCETMRDEVKADAAMFLKTHRWDEGMSAYVPVK